MASEAASLVVKKRSHMHLDSRVIEVAGFKSWVRFKLRPLR